MPKTLKITLTLWFELHEVGDMMFADSMEEVEKIESAFALMEDDGPFNWQNHLLGFDPIEFVKYLGDFENVKSATWLPDGKVEYIMEMDDETCDYCDDKTDEGIIRHVRSALLDESLEDGNYEGINNGWVV